MDNNNRKSRPFVTDEAPEPFIINELFEGGEPDALSCTSCQWESRCKLIHHLNTLAEASGKDPINKTFFCSYHE